MFDPSDCQEQRAKMREIAKQRALQLQKEEEERIREQKAKAHAKLEELNRRTQATDGNGSTQKLEKAPPSVSIQQEKEECQVPTEQVMVASKSETPTSELVSNPNAQTTKSSDIEAVESTHLSNAPPMEMSENPQLKPVVPHAASAALLAIWYFRLCCPAVQMNEVQQLPKAVMLLHFGGLIWYRVQ